MTLSNQITLEDNTYNFAIPADTFAYTSVGAGDTLAYSATMANGAPLPSWLTFDAAAGTFSGTPGNWDVSTLNLSVIATNASGHAASSNFTLEVLNVNDAPTVVAPLADQSITEELAFSYTLPGGATQDGFLNDAMDTGTAGQVWPNYSNYVGGGVGNDIYSFARGNGNVYFYDWDTTIGNIDTIQLADVLPADISVAQNQWGDVTLSVNGTADSLTLGNWLYSDASKIEQLVFADGAVWGTAEIQSRLSTAQTSGNDYVTGAGVDETLLGGSGNDGLVGAGGSDLLSGGSGNDSLTADVNYADGANDLLLGGGGNDDLIASISNDLLIGGPGDDYISGDDGNDVILFNRGDGYDWIDPWSSGIATQADSISLGGGIEYTDISFSRDWDNLILNTGNGESLTFDSWFGQNWADPSVQGNKVIDRLQIVAEGMAGYDPNSAEPLLNKRIQQFDFAGLANQFEAALTADPTITAWQLAPYLADFYLGGSDMQAIGGDMAYLYGKNGNLDGLTEAELRAQLNDAGFGTGSQTLTKAMPMAGTGVFNDVDFIHGDRITCTATLADGSPLPAWLTFDAATGTFSGTPASTDAGILDVAVTATDSGGLSATTSFRLSVESLNAAPVAIADLVAINEDGAQATIAVADLLANDTDPNPGDVLSVSAFDTVTAQGNTVTQDGNGNLVLGIGNNYQSLGAGQTATDSFGYTITDAAGLTSSATVDIEIASVNDAPVIAAPIAGQQTNEDAPFSFAIPADTFTDIDNGDILTYSATLADGTALPSWLSFDAATQSFSGTPLNADVGSLNVLVTATDTGGLSASSAFDLNVVNVNDAPTASADSGVATEDGGAVLLDAETLLANDADPDFIHGDVLNIVGVSQAASGATVSMVNGGIQYDIGTLFQSLAQGQTATDTFNYTVSDTAGTTSAAQVTMTVTGVNDGPVTADDAAAVQEDTSITATGNVLANDSDVDQGTVLSVANAGILQGQYGSLVLNADGSYTYALDNKALAVQSRAQGQAVIEQFAYQATDGTASTPAILTVTIAGTNDAPVTEVDTLAVQEDMAIVSTGNVLANDTDVDQGTVLQVANAGVFAGQFGELTLNADGSYTYALDNVSPGVQGLAQGQAVTDTFAYQATDGLVSTPSMLTVTIAGTNDAPVVVADTADVQEDLNTTATANVLANDTDVDQGTVLSVANAGSYQGNFGALTLNADGSYSYALDNTSLGVQSLAQGQVVTDTFDYHASDGITSTPSTLTVSITGTNDAPVTTVDAAAVREDMTLTATGNVLANDSDIDQGAILSVANAGAYQGSYGSLLLNADGSYTYSLDNGSLAVQSLAEGQVVADTFDYQASDGITSTPSALTVSVTGTNDAPVTAADTASVQEDLNITATGNVLSNDTDVDQGTVLSVANSGTQQGSYGQLALAGDGSYTYSLDNNSLAVQSLGRDAQVAEQFGYTATDGIVGTASVLDVFLDGANDAPILVAPLADQNFTFDKHFSWQVPDGSFIDIDQGDTLDYAATLADGSALPDWLKFDAATRTFSGETPKEKGCVDVQVTATDKVAATGSTAGSLSASDVFRITVSHGNEGVGNGEDAPPPGHDHNTNDGHGTAPGHPGSKGGNSHPTASAAHPNEQQQQDHSYDAGKHKDAAALQDSGDSGSRRTDELIRAWFEEESISERYASFGALDRHGAWGGQIDWQVKRNVAKGVSGDVSSAWERMNAQLKEHLEQSGADDGIAMDSGTGSGSFGLFGSGGREGFSQLGLGNGQQMNALAGLKEGLERLGY